MPLVQMYVQGARKVCPAKRKAQIGDLVWYQADPKDPTCFPQLAKVVSLDRQYIWVQTTHSPTRTRDNTIVSESYYTLHLEGTDTHVMRVSNTQITRMET